MTRKVAIIGSAGRGPEFAHLMTRELWDAAAADLRGRILPDDDFFSGGAAWFDHLAVRLFLEDVTEFPTQPRNLKLFLPAPIESNGVFQGPSKSPGSTTNWYHEKFSEIIQENSRGQIILARRHGAVLHSEPIARGYGPFFVRNGKVAAEVDTCFAYTWGEGDEPMDGGTKYTWDRIEGNRVHIPLRSLIK